MHYLDLRKSRVHVYLADKNAHSSYIHNKCLESFAKGCKGKILGIDNYQESDLAVVYGTYKKNIPQSYPRGEIISKQKEKGHKTIIIDNGFIRKDSNNNNYFSVGYDNIIGWGNYRNNSMPSDRWNKLNIDLKEWRKNNDNNHIIICGQIPWDASNQHIDINKWLFETSNKIRLITKRKIIYRPHPKAIKYNPPSLLECVTSHKSIVEDFENAHCTIVFNSTSSIESIISGVPVICLGDGCMAQEVAVNKIEMIENLLLPDRKIWLSNLCYAQWNVKEMTEGQPWLHLTR